MTHPNDMTQWADIDCQRGHETHDSVPVAVGLGVVEHGYHDYPQVPQRLARNFVMEVWPPEKYPVDGGPYCPAHDAVSATILSHHIWEPRETILTLSVLSSPEPGLVYDIGAQLGWFSLLAASCGRHVIAFDAEAENLRLLASSAEANGWEDSIELVHVRIGAQAPVPENDGRIRLAKLDIEGAEEAAVDGLWPAIEEGRLDFMMMEVSPCFHEGYPELVQRVVGAGYRAYALPPKRQPPWPLDDPEHDMEAGRLDTLTGMRDLIAGWHQEDVWFAREGVTW